MIQDSQKTSLGWVVSTTKISIDRVLEIIINDPNYVLEDDVIIDLRMLSAAELKERFQKQDFDFEQLPHENGALLYFKAKLKNE